MKRKAEFTINFSMDDEEGDYRYRMVVYPPDDYYSEAREMAYDLCFKIDEMVD